MATNEVNGIINILKKATEDELQNQIEVDWESLKIAASEFLQWNASFKSFKIQAQKRTGIVAMKDIKGYDNFSSDLIKTAKVSKSFYKALFKFDAALTKYLKEMPKRGIYVFFDEKGRPSTYEMSMENLANISQGRGRIGDLNRKDLQSIESQIDETSKGDLEHINKGACAAMGVNNRLNRFYERRGKQTIINKNGDVKTRTAQKQGGLLMWKIGSEWKIAKIANQGVIGEAYATFLMTRHKTKKDYLVGVAVGKPDYFSHSLIDKFYKYLSTVTNAPAIVEEDIYTEWAQYAVKGRKAGLPAPEQYIRTAYTILSSSDEISPNNLKIMIKDEFNKDSQLAPFIGSFLDKDIENVTKDMLKSSGFYEGKNISTIYKF